ncbi:MAG: hypothetical protein ACJ75J_18580, partial [Cytophagaceae bacterium]
MRFLILFLFSLPASAKTYFVKIAGGNGNGLSDATAWSYARLNAASLQAGDRVLLKKGDVFFGALKVQSGVTYGSYGHGTNPVITGLKQVSGWQHYSGKIYSLLLDLSTGPNLVLLDGQPQSMGRYPNTGYLPYTGHAGNTAISGPAIAALPFNAAGAEAVIRKERWILDRQPVISQNGSMLQLSAVSTDGGYNGRPGVDK